SLSSIPGQVTKLRSRPMQGKRIMSLRIRIEFLRKASWRPTFGLGRTLALPFIMLAICATSRATNYDEAKVGTYTLPDPLTLANGKKVTDSETWFNQRRPEILKLFEENQFGKSPPKPSDVMVNVWDKGSPAIDGNAIRRQLTIHFNGKKDGPAMDVVMYLPASAPKPVPLFLCLSFSPQYRLYPDPNIKLREYWNP